MYRTIARLERKCRFARLAVAIIFRHVNLLDGDCGSEINLSGGLGTGIGVGSRVGIPVGVPGEIAGQNYED
jgi:hypothetical protein